MSETIKKGFLVSIKGFFIIYGLPILVVFLIIWVAFKLPGAKLFESLINKSKKKGMEENHRKTMVKIEENKAVQEKLREEIKVDSVNKVKNEEKIKTLEKELKDFEKKVNDNKNNIDKLDAMADNVF